MTGIFGPLFCTFGGAVSKFLAVGGYNSTRISQVRRSYGLPRIQRTMTSNPKESLPVGAPSQERFRFGSTFASADLEQQYRQSQLVSNRVAATWCILAAALGCGLFLSSDYRLFGQSTQFLVLLGMRTLTIAISIAALVLLRRTQAPVSFNAILWTWSMIYSLGAAYVNSTRFRDSLPANIIITVEIGAFLILLASLPLSPLVCAESLSASVNTIAGPILHNMADPEGQGMTQAAVLQAYFVANLLGIITSIQFHRRNRQLFAAARRQTELTANLEQALTEIRTLRGILPICSHCKRVRNDAGAWEEVEVYVRKHTHAEFTHDICPECAQQHFGKYAEC